MQKSFLFFRKSIDDRSPLAEYADSPNETDPKFNFIEDHLNQGRTTWAQVFDAYVQSGYYSKFIRDISRIFSPEEIQQINRNIRQEHIDNASSGNSPTATLLRGASLSDDGNEIDLPEESRQMLRQQEPSLRRLLVGNHGIYAESSSPNAGEMIRVAPQGQYEHWQNGDRKYYKQLRGVNYADYRPGMWYAALGDYNLEPQRITLRQLIDGQNPFMSDEFLKHLDEEDTDYPFEDHTDAPVKVQGILSNFSPQDGGLIVNGKRYKTPEHLYQSLKFTDPSHRQQIVDANNGMEAKRISRQLSTSLEGNSHRRNWQDIQDHIMRWVVSQRMEQQPSFRRALLATGDRPIVEDEGSRSTTRWGTTIQFTPDGQSFRGQNVMGKILMSVRDQYRAQAERDRSEDSPPTSSPAPIPGAQQPLSTVSINNNDIFNSNADAIVNSVNTRLSPSGRGVMGAGLAKTFKDIFGENSDYFRGYERAISRGEGYIYDANGRVAEGTRFGPGMARIYKITDADRQRAQETLGRPFSPKYIIDAAVKRSWQEQSSSQWVQDAITSAGHAIRESGTIFPGQSEPISSITFPVLGANMGSRGANVPGMPPPPTREQSVQMLQNGLSQYGIEGSISMPDQINPRSNTRTPVAQQEQSQNQASFSISDVPLMFTANHRADFGPAQSIPISRGVPEHRGIVESWQGIEGLPRDFVPIRTGAMPSSQTHQTASQAQKDFRNRDIQADEFARIRQESKENYQSGQGRSQLPVYEILEKIKNAEANRDHSGGYALSCYEDLSDESNFCHRRWLANDIENSTGVPIPDIAHLIEWKKRLSGLTPEERSMHPFDLYKAKVWDKLQQLGAGIDLSSPNGKIQLNQLAAQQIPSYTQLTSIIRDYDSHAQRSRPKSSNIEELAEIVHPASEDEDHEAMRRQSRIIIAGPRTSTLAPNGDASKGELAGQALAVWLGRSLFPEHFGKDLSVISGGAYGSDQSGEILAEMLGIPALAMPARWNEVGAAHSQGNSRVAGPVRNVAMANRATGAIITLPSWHDIKFKVINRGGNAGIKIDPSIFGTNPTRNVTFSLNSENSIQNIINLLKGDTSDEKKNLFRETFGVEIPNGLKEEDIKEAMMLALSRGNVDLPDSIKDSDLYKEAMSKWDGQPDTEEEMEDIHQSKSTGSKSMSQTAADRKLPTIRVFRSHSRGGGKIREITVSPPTTALRVAVPQFVLYSSDDPEKAQEGAESLRTYLGMSEDTFPSQDEIQGRLERISSFFNGRGTDLSGRKNATQLSGHKRVADHSYWSPSEEQMEGVEDHELTHMIDEHGLDTSAGMTAPVKIPRGAVPIIHGKPSRGFVSESFTSGSPPETYLSMGSIKRLPLEKLSIVPAVAREAVLGNGEIHPKTIVERVRPRLQMSYKSKIFPFALWPIR